MLPNTITYTFNHDNDGGTTAAVSVTLTRHKEELDKTVYHTGSHSMVAPDTLSFHRTSPKRSGDFLGVQRVAVKRTRTVPVDNAAGLETKVPNVEELAFSLPIGMTDAQKISAVMEWIGFLSSNEGKDAMIRLLKTSEI